MKCNDLNSARHFYFDIFHLFFTLLRHRTAFEASADKRAYYALHNVRILQKRPYSPDKWPPSLLVVRGS